MNDIIKVASAFKHLAPQSLGQGVGGGFSLIGYKGKVWSLRHNGETYYFTRDDDGTPLPYIDVVILGENPNVSKTYYPQGTYTEDAANPPTCSSLNQDVPDPGVPIPQSQTCGTCKRNVWTTLQTGNKGQECKDSKRLAVLLMPAMTAKMLDEPLLSPVFLKVPGGSLRPLKMYGDSLTHQGAHPASVVTRITFVRDKQFEMKFEVKQPLTNDEAPVILPLLDDPQTINIMGTRPAIREVQEVLPPKREERIETGILGAFGKGASAQTATEQGTVPTVRRGRPPGSVNKPKPAVPLNPAPEVPEHAVVEDNGAPGVPEQASLPWDESDGELDSTLQKVIDAKVQGMLK